IPVVVAINKFPTDTEAEIAYVRQAALDAGASDAHVSTLFSDGGKGGEDLAHALVKAADEPSSFRFLYPLDASLKEKIETIATKIYGADGVDYEPLAEKQLAMFEERGFGKLPICMAKTQYSLSHDPALKGRPTGFRFVVRDARVAVGAGFVYPLAGAIMTMPGLGKVPGGARMDIDENGDVVGML
ncbi:MAG: formate--tetrahydrofolate ligase, partial [Planctomycetes bacterium]|nr:formate--tetrahydrofolate ligase [Planctomycetota bacterium]